MSLSRLESHLTTCGGQYIVHDELSLSDVVVWSTLYVLLAPDGNISQGMQTNVVQYNRDLQDVQETLAPKFLTKSATYNQTSSADQPLNIAMTYV